jgi:hypothetical protein
MAYFNHAFTKMFLGTGATRTAGSGGVPNPATALIPASTGGFITTDDTTTATLSTLSPGYFMFVDPKTYKRVAAPTNCCPLILASSSLLGSDKTGPFHGGYKETNKSKVINPKFVHKFYRVDSCTPEQSVVSIGNTSATAASVATFAVSQAGAGYIDGTYYNVPFTGGTGTGFLATVVVAAGVPTVTVTNGGIGYTVADVLVPDANFLNYTFGGTELQITVATLTTVTGCCFEFLCGETYYLRLDLKGSPLLRFLNHNAYQNLAAYTGCCDPSNPGPVAVDSTLVMITWAQGIVDSAYFKDFVFPIVYDEAGTAWFAPGTTVDPQGNAVTAAQWWSNYVSPGHTPGACAGLRLFGAYVETKFGNCSFQVTDFYEKEPVKILASLVDLNGDPCTFEGICFVTECAGVQGMGFGETVVRDLIKAESYLQNFFATDIRIREITQGDDILNVVNRNALYTRYYLLHTVPRYNNPSGVFDNDQYMLEIITSSANAALETYVTTWLTACPNCVELEEHSCTPCTVAAI